MTLCTDWSVSVNLGNQQCFRYALIRVVSFMYN